MMNRILALFSPRRRRALKAERLLICVEQLGSIILDRQSLEQLGLKRRVAVRLVCHLLFKERIHMTTDSLGRIVLMSNIEYERYTRNRADGDEEPEVRIFNGIKSMVVKEFEDIRSSADERSESKALPVGEDSAAFFAVSPPLLGNEMGGEYYNADDGFDPDDDAAKTASGRQSVPERRREPWKSSDLFTREKE